MTDMKECISIEQLEKKKSKLFDEMGKHPEKEQELSQEYWTLDQQIINFYKSKIGEKQS